MKIIQQYKYRNDESFLCGCGCLAHCFSLCFIEKYREDPAELYLNLLLQNYKRWWQRIPVGLRFIFWNESYDKSIFDTVILEQGDMDRFINFLKLIAKEPGDFCTVVDIDTDQYVANFFIEIDEWDGPEETKEKHVTSEFTLGFKFPSNLSFISRLWRGIKYICGWVSRYGYNTDEATITKQQAKSLMKIAMMHRDLTEEDVLKIQS